MTEFALVDPCQDPRWEALVSGARGGLFVSPNWLRALRDTYGFEFSASLVLDGDVPVSGFAWKDVVDLRGRRIVGLPFCDFADPILADDAHWEDLLRPAMASGVPVRLRTRLASNRLDGDPRFEATEPHRLARSRPCPVRGCGLAQHRRLRPAGDPQSREAGRRHSKRHRYRRRPCFPRVTQLGPSAKVRHADPTTGVVREHLAPIRPRVRPHC